MALLRYICVALLLAGITSALTGIRLRGGKHLYEGRIEVEHEGQWKAICDHGWNKNAARVVCRMLGYPDMLRYTKGLVTQKRQIWPDNLRLLVRRHPLSRR